MPGIIRAASREQTRQRRSHAWYLGYVSPPLPPPPPVIGTYPTYTVEIALNAPTAGQFVLDVSQLDSGTLGAPYGSPTFQAIPGVRSIHTRRGRQQELGQSEPGTVDVVLDNSDGSLSPGNINSPYWPNIVPMRQIRVSAIWQGETTPLFLGFIESYTPTPFTPVNSDMQIHAVDWFKLANLCNLVSVYPAQTASARIAAVLADVGVAGLPSDIDSDTINLIASTMSQTAALSHIHDVETASMGLCYCRANGTIAYESVHYRQVQTRCTTVQAIFGQPDPTTGKYAAGTLPFVSVDYTMDDHLLYNDVQVTASGAGEAMQEVQDVPSQQLYFKRSLSISSQYLAAGQAIYQAQWLLLNYKDPRPRATRLVLDGDADDGTNGLWATLLGLEISDRVHLTENLPGLLGVNLDCWIDAIEHDIKIDLGGHIVTLQLNGTGTMVAPFTLDVSHLDMAQLGI